MSDRFADNDESVGDGVRHWTSIEGMALLRRTSRRASADDAIVLVAEVQEIPSREHYASSD